MAKTREETPKETQETPVANNGLPVIELTCKSFTVNKAECTIHLNDADPVECGEMLGRIVKAHKQHGQALLTFNLDDGKKKDTCVGWIYNFSPWTIVLKHEPLS